DLTGLTGLGFHIIEVEPGAVTTEHHVHYFEDECVYVLSGEATSVIGEERTPIKAGDFLGYRKGGEAHSIENTGSETLRCLVVGQRLAHDVGDYPRLGKRIYRNAGMAWDLADIDAIEEPQAGAGSK
ncbi:MAG: cupin domain-containing protein, partial [Pseudomonadota bacterium]